MRKLLHTRKQQKLNLTNNGITIFFLKYESELDVETFSLLYTFAFM